MEVFETSALLAMLPTCFAKVVFIAFGAKKCTAQILYHFQYEPVVQPISLVASARRLCTPLVLLATHVPHSLDPTIRAAVERVWHKHDNQDQVLALTLR